MGAGTRFSHQTFTQIAVRPTRVRGRTIAQMHMHLRRVGLRWYATNPITFGWSPYFRISSEISGQTSLSAARHGLVSLLYNLPPV